MTPCLWRTSGVICHSVFQVASNQDKPEVDYAVRMPLRMLAQLAPVPAFSSVLHEVFNDPIYSRKNDSSAFEVTIVITSRGITSNGARIYNNSLT